jgi:6-pyruvoyltetrahydropterin/6-carboxytetrahydropterin synthase
MLKEYKDNMYTVAVIKKFTAQHFLVGGDWGEENNIHSHDYQLELQLYGEKLNHHGYLIDIIEIESKLDMILDYFRNKTLNDLIEFNELNPSIENFSCIICKMLINNMSSKNLNSITVKLWENDFAWASFSKEFK